LVSAAALYSAMRLPFAEPARREGISVVMCSTWAFTLAAETAATTLSSDMAVSSRGDCRDPAHYAAFAG
jgi:hypothetical protein